MTEEKESWFQKVKTFLIGKPKNINESGIFHKISLIAFFAWVGLGADGLSSSCYGPEEAFLTLQNHIFLGVFVTIATIITIFVISVCYLQIIELFPAGGGGYLVASKLLSPNLGMISGCALLVDYVLTITLSVASGADALFSLLPYYLFQYKFIFAVIALISLIVINLRGVKESVSILMPIFLIFLITHVFVILYVVGAHLFDFPVMASNTAQGIQKAHGELGLWGMVLLILRAYSMGAGTFTGIEAVSNGMPILREPRVQTAKRTMWYMAISLALVVGGLMLGYLFYQVHHVPGKTLNAVLLDHIVQGWDPSWGYGFILITLFSEAVLLFVAAQTGFLGGPRVLANMAVDGWVPTHFALLSERFVSQNGVLLMGLASLALMFVSRGSVKFLVVLYSINVFITFSLSLLGMTKHWWNERSTVKKWKSKILVSGFGLVLAVFILLSVLIIKFHEGGWFTIFITGSLVAVAIFIKRFYYKTKKMLIDLDRLAYVVEHKQPEQLAPPVNNKEILFDERGRTAVILVNGFNGMGLHTLFNVVRLFKDSFKNFFFLQAGVVDAGNFKGQQEMESLRKHVDSELQKYVEYMRNQGYYAERFSVIGTDVADELSDKAYEIFQKYPKSVFFGGQIVFPEETLMTKFLYNHVTFALQRRLHHQGIPFVIMPIRVDQWY